ncbi:MAG TPA: hypothetical protein VH120_11870 [Gemmataceae bacterium]|nr:hypothetical protein [Gemmataceae bacterium]
MRKRTAVKVSLDHGRIGDLVRQNLAGDKPSPPAQAIRTEQTRYLAAAIQALPTPYRRLAAAVPPG